MKNRDVSPQELHALLLGADELAVLDLREQGTFGEGHILYASCLPLSMLELRVWRLIPRRGVPIVLCDGGEGLAERGAARLAELGYTDVRMLAGGVPAWVAAGHTAFSGINVPSKAFGEWVEHEFGTPSVSAEELKAMMDRGERVVVLDSRPMDEFRVMSIPGGVCCPGAELVHRVGDAAPDADTTVVVNCAGRTRSIIGAQSLINAGIANRVTALRNGTMGWHLAGFELARGREDRPPPRGDAWRAGSERAAVRLADRFGVEYVDPATLAAWRAEAERRSLYVFDVRSPEEYHEGHLADAVHAAGGQLVQATDEYVGTLGARIALVDDDGVRATLTASWLRQMGWEAYVVRGALESESLVAGTGPADPGGIAAPAAVTPDELEALLGSGEVLVLDPRGQPYLPARAPARGVARGPGGPSRAPRGPARASRDGAHVARRVARVARGRGDRRRRPGPRRRHRGVDGGRARPCARRGGTNRARRQRRLAPALRSGDGGGGRDAGVPRLGDRPRGPARARRHGPLRPLPGIAGGTRLSWEERASPLPTAAATSSP